MAPSSGGKGTVECNEAPAIPRDGRGSLKKRQPGGLAADRIGPKEERTLDGQQDGRGRSVRSSYRVEARARHW